MCQLAPPTNTHNVMARKDTKSIAYAQCQGVEKMAEEVERATAVSLAWYQGFPQAYSLGSTAKV